MSRLPVHKLKTRAERLKLNSGAKAYVLPEWQISMRRGRDPRIARLAVSICRKFGARSRFYHHQAAALLRWMQDPKNFYYVNEAGERIQDPIVTIAWKMGDCDDGVVLLCALFESIRLDWRFVLSGRNPDGTRARYIEGSGPPPEGVKWNHIYCMVGVPPFTVKKWYFCEVTMKVPMGWDIVSGDKSQVPQDLPEVTGEYGAATSALIGGAVGASVADEVSDSSGLDWKKIGLAVGTGVAVSVGTSLLLDLIKGEGLWKETGPLSHRLKRASDFPLRLMFQDTKR